MISVFHQDGILDEIDVAALPVEHWPTADVKYSDENNNIYNPLASDDPEMVKLADRITNLGPPPHHWTAEKIDRYRQEAITLYDALYAANEALANRLQEKIEQYT